MIKENKMALTKTVTKIFPTENKVGLHLTYRRVPMKRAKSIIKKYWTAWLLMVCCTLLFIIPGTPAQAALTMTTSVDEVDAWQAVVAGTLVDGTADNVSDSYATILYIEVAMIEAVAQSGCDVIVEVSYADDNWMQLTTFRGTAETPATTKTAEDPTSAGDPTVTLDDSATGDFDVPGRKWFIKDGTIGNSESVRTKSDAGNVVTLCQDTLREHAVDSDVYDRVDEWVISIPFGVAYVRTLVNNTDADSDVAFTTRISKVTAL